MGSWPYIIGGIITIVLALMTWYGGKERKKEKSQAVAEELLKKSEKTGDPQDVLDAFDDI